jgi:hypothetical protein
MTKFIPIPGLQLFHHLPLQSAITPSPCEPKLEPSLTHHNPVADSTMHNTHTHPSTIYHHAHNSHHLVAQTPSTKQGPYGSPITSSTGSQTGSEHLTNTPPLSPSPPYGMTHVNPSSQYHTTHTTFEDTTFEDISLYSHV